MKLENTEIIMEKSYWIPEGGKPILENVTLRSYKEAAAPYEIKVEGGTLVISNSKIISTETGIAPIAIMAKEGSTLVIEDSELHHVGDVPSGGAITIYCEGAVVEGNIITDSFMGVWLEEEREARSARIVNNTFEGCLEAVHGGDTPWVKQLIEGNTVCNPIPAEKLGGFFAVVSAATYRLLLYWLRDPRVIAGLSVIGIGAIALGWFLFRRRRRRKARATSTG
ncbi:right-handed parallel beta-helix repeat-containing protein [Chloroflexota bacterium]